MVHCWGRPLSNLQLEFVGERAGSWFRGQRQRNFLFKKSTLFAKKPLSLVANLRSAFNIMRVYWVEEGDCPPPSLLDWGEGRRTDWGDTLVFPQKFNFFRSSAFALIFLGKKCPKCRSTQHYPAFNTRQKNSHLDHALFRRGCHPPPALGLEGSGFPHLPFET